MYIYIITLLSPSLLICGVYESCRSNLTLVSNKRYSLNFVPLIVSVRH